MKCTSYSKYWRDLYILFLKCSLKFGKKDVFYKWQILEPRQYKDNSIQSKNIPIMKLPLFCITYTAKEKARQFQNWIFFTEWSRSWIVLALEPFYFCRIVYHWKTKTFLPLLFFQVAQMTKSELDILDTSFLAPFFLAVNQYTGTFSEIKCLWICWVSYFFL